MNQSVMVPVSISAIPVALGYVLVGGFWQDPALVVPHWKNPHVPRPAIWMTQVAPGSAWKEEK